jgi:hypothetical protein
MSAIRSKKTLGDKLMGLSCHFSARFSASPANAGAFLHKIIIEPVASISAFVANVRGYTACLGIIG